MDKYSDRKSKIPFVWMGFELWYYRRKNGYSVYEMAHKIDISIERYRNLECGYYQPSVDEKNKIHKKLNISLNLIKRLCFED